VIFFTHPLAFDDPPEYYHTEKLEWSGYLMVKKTLMIYLAVLTEYRRVTDGRTDRRTMT